MKSEIEIRLRDFDEIPARITNLREEISTIETALVNVRAVSFDGTCSSGTFDPHWLDGRLSKLEILRCQLEFLCAERDLISRNLEELPENERRCLEILVIHKQRGGLVRLMDELQYSQPQIYRIRKAALERLSIRLYGR